MLSLKKNKTKNLVSLHVNSPKYEKKEKKIGNNFLAGKEKILCKSRNNFLQGKGKFERARKSFFQ